MHCSWGRAHRFLHHVARPSFADELAPLLAAAVAENRTVLGHGLARSYGDSCLNEGQVLIEMRRLDRFIDFDCDTGIIEVEGGVTLAAILDLLERRNVPGRSWFLPVTPGTKFVTVGGAIANDVHGKNHHAAGCFGNHVLALRVLTSTRGLVSCSPQREPELFAATIGGLGLTGLIVSARLQLKPVPSLWLEAEDVRYDDLDAFRGLTTESERDWEYTVAWIDCLACGDRLGRGVFTRARHAEPSAAGQHRSQVVRAPRLSLPLDLPAPVLGSRAVALFNAMLWRRAPRRPRRRVRPYDPVFYPLDAIGQWNRIYGARGFFQYQCVIPTAGARDAIRDLVATVAEEGRGSFLAVLKIMGERRSPGLLSFPLPGVTLALDFPNRGAPTLALLDRLDRITEAAGGRIYPAKDGRVSAAAFQAGYPQWRAFARLVDPLFSSSFWRRVSAPPGNAREPCDAS